MTNPRLLHIVGASKFGGDSILVLEMGRDAKRRGYAVDVLATDSRFQDAIREEGLGLVGLDVLRREIRPLWDVRGLGRLTRFLRHASYDIVHTHTSKPGVVGRLAATLAGVPTIVHTVHGFGFHEETGPLATAAYVSVERLAGRWCHVIVTVSEFHRDRALALGIGDSEKVIAIPNGVPSDRARSRRPAADVRAELGLRDEVMVLSTGRLAEQKGLEYLVRAAPLLRGGGPPIRILLAGDGPLADELSALVSELGVEDVVTMLGFRADVGDLLAAADIVALPSLWEGLSISLLEAMAAAKPIVTTTIGSNREVSADGQSAVLVPPKDPASLAAAIGELARDGARRQALGARARERQVERYSMRPMLDAYAEQYEAVLRRTPRRAAPGRAEMVDAA